jgi:hypothetical protein
MKKSLILYSFVLLAACEPAAKWDSYTYNGQLVAVQNDKIITEHDTSIDRSQMEFVAEVSCTTAEANAHDMHAKEKFLTFQKTCDSVSEGRSVFGILPENSVEFHFITEETGGIPLEWGVEMLSFDSSNDSTKTRIRTIGYILRTGQEEAVMYEIDDSTTTYYGYNNLLYAKLMNNLSPGF